VPINICSADIKFKLQNKRKLMRFIGDRVAEKPGREFSIAYVFCSDDFLLDINQRFLHHDFYTDVITFPLTDDDVRLEAEIYISVDRVRDNALKLKVDFEDELHRVMFHGVLHLLGFKDKARAQVAAMRKAEERWLKEYDAMGT
jgi:rRNA maturation RNase YbeY